MMYLSLIHIFLTEIRKTLRMPVIALTAKAGLSDKVNVLGSGADDYITKPFEKQELLARIQAQLRRAGDYSAVQADASSPQKLTCRELELYPENHRVLLRGEEIPLTTDVYKRQDLQGACRDTEPAARRTDCL